MLARYVPGCLLIALLGACVAPPGTEARDDLALSLEDADDEIGAHYFVVTRVEQDIAYVKAPNRSATVCGNGMAAAECRVGPLDFSASRLPAPQVDAFKTRFLRGIGLIRGELVQPSSAADAPDTLLVDEAIEVAPSTAP
jgi:hypothetical protein